MARNEAAPLYVMHVDVYGMPVDLSGMSVMYGMSVDMYGMPVDLPCIALNAVRCELFRTHLP